MLKVVQLCDFPGEGHQSAGAPWGSDWDVGGVALAVGLWEGGLMSGGI